MTAWIWVDRRAYALSVCQLIDTPDGWTDEQVKVAFEAGDTAVILLGQMDTMDRMRRYIVNDMRAELVDTMERLKRQIGRYVFPSFRKFSDTRIEDAHRSICMDMEAMTLIDIDREEHEE